MIAYTLLVHDEKYPNMPDQVAGVFTDANNSIAVKKAMKTAHEHWHSLAGIAAMPLNFTSYDSSNTGLDFHTGNVYRDNGAGRVTYSINGFNTQ